jgi:hypothetical protein
MKMDDVGEDDVEGRLMEEEAARREQEFDAAADAAYDDYVERKYEAMEGELQEFIGRTRKLWSREKLLRYMVAFAERKLLEVKVDD